MNKFIKEQLENCKAELPYWDDSTLELLIPKEAIESGDILIKGDLAVFPEIYMRIKILEKAGTMVKIEGKGKQQGTPFKGWVSRKGFKVVG